MADIWYYRDSSELNSIRTFYHIYRAAGFFGYPSEAALVIIFLFVLIVGCTDIQESKLIVYLVLAILAVGLTQSRVGLGFLAILLFLYFRFSRKKLILSVMPLLLFPVLSNMAFTYFYGSFSENIESSNIATRASEFTFFIDSFFSKSLPIINVNQYREFYGTLESYYLTLLLRGGTFAVLAEVITQLCLLVYLVLIKVETRNIELFKWFTVITVFLNVSVLNFFSGVFVQGKSAVIVWMLIGAFVGTAKIGIQLSHLQIKPRWRTRRDDPEALVDLTAIN